MQERGPKKKLCIATTEFQLFHKNGGIGTANTGLAIAMSQAGHDVTVVLGTVTEDENTIRCKTFFESNYNIKICIVPLPKEIRLEEVTEYSLGLSYCFHCWLSTQDFDVVNLDDFGAMGYYALVSKKIGVSYLETRFICQVHGPTDWLIKGQGYPFNGLEHARSIDAERFVIENADETVFVSRYMYDYLKSCGYSLDPASCHVKSYISPFWLINSTEETTHYKKELAYKPASIAFFGRQEHRKGFQLFLDTVDQLNADGFDLDIFILVNFHSLQLVYTPASCCLSE